MQVREVENLKIETGIMNSGRPIYIPEGLHAGKEIFGTIAGRMGLSLEEYPLSVVKNLSDPSLSVELLHYLNRKPALFISPTNLKIQGRLIELAKDKVFSFASVSTGTDHADLKSLRDAGIHFIHAPGANSRSVVEYVLASLPLFYGDDLLLSGSLKFGIVGFGNIGSKLGRCLEKLNFSYSFYDPFVEGNRKSELDEVLASDVVTFHVPLTKDGEHPTYRMADSDSISKIPGNSLIINTSRGQIFSEESYMYACSRCKSIMDVFPEEPPSEKMIQAADIVSPHIAGYNYSARAGGTSLVAENFMKLLGFSDYIAEYSKGNYNIFTVDFLQDESDFLKNNPSSFRHRRENYPDRGDFSDTISLNSQKKYSGFLKKILNLCSTIQ